MGGVLACLILFSLINLRSSTPAISQIRSLEVHGAPKDMLVEKLVYLLVVLILSLGFAKQRTKSESCKC